MTTKAILETDRITNIWAHSFATSSSKHSLKNWRLQQQTLGPVLHEALFSSAKYLLLLHLLQFNLFDLSDFEKLFGVESLILVHCCVCILLCMFGCCCCYCAHRSQNDRSQNADSTMNLWRICMAGQMKCWASIAMLYKYNIVQHSDSKYTMWLKNTASFHLTKGTYIKRF